MCWRFVVVAPCIFHMGQAPAYHVDMKSYTCKNISYGLEISWPNPILQNLYSQWRKQSVLHGKMDGRLSLLMVAGLRSLSIPYWWLGTVQKYWRKFELFSCPIILVRSESSIFPARWLRSKSLLKCSKACFFLRCSSQLWFLSQVILVMSVARRNAHFRVLRSAAGRHTGKVSPM